MEAVFLYLLNHAIAGTWMLLAVLAARALLKKVPRRWVLLLWLLAALRLALPALPESRTSLVPETTPVQVVGAIQEQETITEAPSEEVSCISRVEIASWVWAAGAAGMAIYAAVSDLRLRRRVRESVPLHDNVRLCDGISTPFLLGLSWSTTERMSSQQADILTSEIDAYRRELEPVVLQICNTFLRLEGFDCPVSVDWEPLTLQDITALSQSALLDAQTEKIRREIGEDKHDI